VPSATNDDLPARTRTHLPQRAQDISSGGFSTTPRDPMARASPVGRDEIAHRVAWAAVKQGYRNVAPIGFSFEVRSAGTAGSSGPMRTGVSGIATGLAWTPVGGDILLIESTRTPGSGKLVRKGQLDEVMPESAQEARSVVKKRAATRRGSNGDGVHDRGCRARNKAVAGQGRRRSTLLGRVD
jgi:cation transport regulator ChaB